MPADGSLPSPPRKSQLFPASWAAEKRNTPLHDDVTMKIGGIAHLKMSKSDTSRMDRAPPQQKRPASARLE
jgi:hypothetical protein